MHNRLLLGAAVEMSNAVGLKKNRLLGFCHWNLSVHQSRETMQESSNLCLLRIVPVRKKIIFRLEQLYLATNKYFVIAKCDKFGALSQLCCLGYFVVFVTVFDSC